MEFFFGIELFAKTFGIRRIVKNDENILPVSLCLMCSPFILFVSSMVYELKCYRKKKDDKPEKALESDKKAA